MVLNDVILNNPLTIVSKTLKLVATAPLLTKVSKNDTKLPDTHCVGVSIVFVICISESGVMTVVTASVLFERATSGVVVVMKAVLVIVPLDTKPEKYH